MAIANNNEKKPYIIFIHLRNCVTASNGSPPNNKFHFSFNRFLINNFCSVYVFCSQNNFRYSLINGKG